MNSKNLNAVVILGIISLASILVVQMVWMRKTVAIQQTNIAIQEKEDFIFYICQAIQEGLDVDDNLKDVYIQEDYPYITD